MTEVQFLDRLRKHYEQNLPFVVYRKPGAEQVQAFLQQNDQLFSSEDFTEKGFVFAPFDDREQNMLIPVEASEKLILETSEITPDDENSSFIESLSEANTGAREMHISLIEKALEKLRSEELEKVVLSRREKINLPEADPVELFQRLLKTYPSAFVYLWYHPSTKCWLAATPETLLKVEGSRFSTMALAGTQKYMGSTDVSWGEKEKQEQLFVTGSILQNLEKAGISPAGTKKSEVYTAKAGNLLHLKTDVSGRLDPKKSLGKVISALHPTPAVCGLPKEKAKEFIISEEGYNREFYTGFLGEINLQKNLQRSSNRRNVENLAYRAVKQETSLFVNLRCMKIDGNTVSIYVGGGITKDSDPEAEWEETVNKSQTMKKVLFK